MLDAWRGFLSIVMAGVTVVAQRSWAAPFDARNVDGDATAVIFVDLDAAKESTLGATLLAKLTQDRNYAEIQQFLIDLAGFAPVSDIADITIYGDAAHPGTGDGAAIIHADYDKTALRNAIGIFDGFRSEWYGDHEILRWHDGITRKSVFASLYDARTIVMCNSDDQVAHAIDVLEDTTPSLDITGRLPTAPKGKGTWAFVTADASKLPNKPANAALSKVEIVSAELGEADGKTTLAVTSSVDGGEDRDALKQYLIGMRSVLSLAGTFGDAKNLAVVLAGELAAAATIVADDHAVIVKTQLTNEHAAEWVEKILVERERLANP